MESSSVRVPLDGLATRGTRTGNGSVSIIAIDTGRVNLALPYVGLSDDGVTGSATITDDA